MKFIPLPRTFYEPTAKIVAKRLLGQWLIRKTATGLRGGPIVETEAYLIGDPASHCFGGQTLRNRVMFGPPGFAYVYFIYGAHFCLNAVCQPAGKAEAVLIRAIEAGIGEDQMRANRPAVKLISLTNGPGKLCAALAIDRKLDGADLCEAASDVMIAENPNLKAFRKQRGPIVKTTRIGITRAADLHLRFFLAGSAFISRPVREPSPPAIGPLALPNLARPEC